MSTAVITLVHGRHEHLHNQYATLCRQASVPTEYVIVAMGDPELSLTLVAGGPRVHIVHVPLESQELPLSTSRNAGVSRALDLGSDVLICLDVDCLAGEQLVRGYTDVVRSQPETIWSGPVTYLPPAPPAGYPLDRLASLDSPHPARPAPEPGSTLRPADPNLFWSLSFAVHRSTWTNIGGFCEGYVGYGGEDTDFARLALRASAGLGWTGTPRAYHQYHATQEPPVQHLDSILRNARLFRQRWGQWPMQGWLRSFAERGLIESQNGVWVRTNQP